VPSKLTFPHGKEVKPEATENENTAGEQQIWSANRYLDPDREDEVSRIRRFAT
jgi:hypothetical protein